MFNLSKKQILLCITGVLLISIIGIKVIFFTNQFTITVINGNADNVQISGDTVKIIGPSHFIEKVLSCSDLGWGGYGFGLSWGDGTYSEKCERSHIYNVPGKYIISLSLWHPGPTDAPITDWSEKIQIMVQSIGGNQQSNEIRNARFDKSEYRFNESIFLKYNLDLVQQVSKIGYQFMSKSGIGIGKEAFGEGIANSREIDYRTFPVQEMKEMVLKGEYDFYIKIILYDAAGNKILSKDSKAFRIPSLSLGENKDIIIKKADIIYMDVNYEIMELRNNTIVGSGIMTNVFFDNSSKIFNDTIEQSFFGGNSTSSRDPSDIRSWTQKGVLKKGESYQLKLIIKDMLLGKPYTILSDKFIYPGDPIDQNNLSSSVKLFYQENIPSIQVPPNTIQVILKTNHSDCYNYSIDWGDKIIESNKYLDHTGCELDEQFIVLYHTYKQSGKFHIKFNDNQFDSFVPASLDNGYYENTINIK